MKIEHIAIWVNDLKLMRTLMVKRTLCIIMKRNNLKLILLRSNLEQDLNLCVKKELKIRLI